MGTAKSRLWAFTGDKKSRRFRTFNERLGCMKSMGGRLPLYGYIVQITPPHGAEAPPSVVTSQEFFLDGGIVLGRKIAIG